MISGEKLLMSPLYDIAKNKKALIAIGRQSADNRPIV